MICPSLLIVFFDLCISYFTTYGRLNAADVMNRELKYVHPITQVCSIQQLLQTTSHNAFLVVTPMTLESTTATHVGVKPEVVHESSQANIKQPRLYMRQSVRPLHRPTVLAQKKKRDAMKLREGIAATQETAFYETGAETDAPLIFHGIILRSQLVTLLSNKIFFHADDSVIK